MRKHPKIIHIYNENDELKYVYDRHKENGFDGWCKRNNLPSHLFIKSYKKNKKLYQQETFNLKRKPMYLQYKGWYAKVIEYTEEMVPLSKYTREEIIEKFRATHGDKYDYSKVEYTGYGNPVTIICPIHGEFKQAPFAHINGDRCKECYYDTQRLDKDYVLQRMNETHDYKFDYSKAEWKSTADKIIVICPIHGEFITNVYRHILGDGCKECQYDFIRSRKKPTREDIIMGFKATKNKLLVENLKGCLNKSKEIVSRSSYEINAFDKLQKLYLLKVIKGWASEISVFEYFSPIDKKSHKYYMDVTIIIDKYNVLFVEIKPEKETIPPYKSPKKSDKVYQEELRTWIVNSSKWQAVDSWCKANSINGMNYRFEKWTERELRINT